MVKVFTYEFTDNEGELVIVQVLDKDSVSGPDLTVGGGSFKREYEVEETFNPASPIQFTRVKGSLLISDSTQEETLDEIIQGAEDQFYLTLTVGGEVSFRGIVQVGLISKPRQSYPYLVEIVATDGLKRLSNLEVEMPSSSAVNLIQYFYRILEKTGLQNLFANDDYFLTVACRIYENTMYNAFLTATDPLRYCRVYSPNVLVVTGETNGEKEYRPQIKMLKDVLIAFGLQLKQRNGHYHIIQLDAYEESTLRLHSYTKNIDFNNGNPSLITVGSTILTNFNHAKAIANRYEVLANDSYTYAPPIREVVVEREDFIGQVIQPFSLFDDLDTEISLGNVVGSNNNGLQFLLDAQVNWENTSAPANFYVDFEITIKVGTQVYTNKNGSSQWVAATSGDNYQVTATAQAPPVAASGVWFTNLPINNALGQHQIDTPPIPANGALSIQIAASFRNLAGTDITADFSVTDIEGTLIASYKKFTGFDDNAIALVYGRNEGSSYILDLGALSVGDDPGTNASGKLQVYDGSGWDDASSWRRFNGANPTNRLLLQTIATLFRRQQKALAILNAGLIRSDVSNINTITVDGKALLLQRGSYDYEQCHYEIATTWIEIQTYNTEEGPTGKEVIKPGEVQRPGLYGVGIYGKTQKAVEGIGEVTRTTAIASGTVTGISITAAGVNVGASGDKVLIINPLTGDSEELTLSGNFLAATTEIPVSSTTLSNVYPIGSLISLKVKDVISRVYALENA